MKNETGGKLKLGIFVSLALALFIAGIYLIGERQQLFSSTFHVSGVFKDISGLQIGNNVRFSGINVGVIEDIQQITDTTVKVDMQIDEKSRKFIKKNANAIIGSDGLMGNRIVIITPGFGNTKELEDDDFIKTAQAVSMDEILSKLKVTADNAADITGNLAAVMENIKQGKGTVGKLLMDSTMATDVSAALVNIKQGAGGFKQNMNAASKNVLLRGYFKKKKKNTNDKEEK
ncbi:MAG: MCE family protein [Bacteroidia bacterium]|nr:MCE family protein [Bacteroidia bacterium]